jgi:hypothetical protein
MWGIFLLWRCEEWKVAFTLRSFNKPQGSLDTRRSGRILKENFPFERLLTSLSYRTDSQRKRPLDATNSKSFFFFPNFKKGKLGPINPGSAFFNDLGIMHAIWVRLRRLKQTKKTFVWELGSVPRKNIIHNLPKWHRQVFCARHPSPKTRKGKTYPLMDLSPQVLSIDSSQIVVAWYRAMLVEKTPKETWGKKN